MLAYSSTYLVPFTLCMQTRLCCQPTCCRLPRPTAPPSCAPLAATSLPPAVQAGAVGGGRGGWGVGHGLPYCMHARQGHMGMRCTCPPLKPAALQPAVAEQLITRFGVPSVTLDGRLASRGTLQVARPVAWHGICPAAPRQPVCACCVAACGTGWVTLLVCIALHTLSLRKALNLTGRIVFSSPCREAGEGTEAAASRGRCT